MLAEELRLEEAKTALKHWKRWGPYLSERQWGTVREDYSADGSAWDYFTHAQATMRAYRWGEDGIAGFSDNHQRLCFGIALWNGVDKILKERLFGLTWSEGNHGESVKEYYSYLDSAPTHSYMKHLYRYPHQAFPYEQLLAESRKRSRLEPEFELIETGVFDGNRFFDVFTEFAKRDAEDIFIRVTVCNRGPNEASLVLLPTLWFRNTWSWKRDRPKPNMRLANGRKDIITLNHGTLGQYHFSFQGTDEVLFTENETNCERVFHQASACPYTKDAFHRYVIENDRAAVNPANSGTKASPVFRLTCAAGSETSVTMRLCEASLSNQSALSIATDLFAKRQAETDEFYSRRAPVGLQDDLKLVQREAFAGMLWTKQYYHYVVQDWLDGDETSAPPPAERRKIRNTNWNHLYNDDILSMPDKWEYPWYASWDSAFHVIPLAMIDPDFAKRQLILLTREWYMHPNGQIPAYEWDFSDVTPPVQAWAAYRIFKIERRMTGKGDREFLERVFQKLLLNFTWWVNRKDPFGQNVFEGGFLGLDNIGVFDRSKGLPQGGKIKQSDSTSWMAMYCLNMLVMSIELAKDNPAYQDIASKFFEHFLYIAYAMNHRSADSSISGLWDDEDGFYYDILHLPNQQVGFLKVRSLVGLIPLFAVLTLEPEIVDQMPGFQRRMRWFIENRPDLKQDVASMDVPGAGQRLLLALVNQDRLKRILKRMLDPEEFLSPYGIRSVSKYHEKNPYVLRAYDQEYRVGYEPAESTSPIYGGNSNWRGPIWWPINYLIIEAVQRFSHYYEDNLTVECPTGSGNYIPLWNVGAEISHRLLKIFAKDEDGKRPCDKPRERAQAPGFFDQSVSFYEYFHGDTGKGLGASHQTGWTGLVAKLIEQSGKDL
ncbi:MAG: glucosidase [Bdellovibrionota bacterium]